MPRRFRPASGLQPQVNGSTIAPTANSSGQLFLRTSPPTSADGIEKYLSSGMIRGIGPAYAKKLVRSFGEKVFDVSRGLPPERLRRVGTKSKAREGRQPLFNSRA